MPKHRIHVHTPFTLRLGSALPNTPEELRFEKGSHVVEEHVKDHPYTQHHINAKHTEEVSEELELGQEGVEETVEEKEEAPPPRVRGRFTRK
jgi:hypothetical protein